MTIEGAMTARGNKFAIAKAADPNPSINTAAIQYTVQAGYAATESENYDGSNSATVTAGNNTSDSAKYVRISRLAPVTGVSLNKTSTALMVGESETLTAVAEPKDSAYADLLEWDSSDSGVATVSESGEVTAVAVGKATITVRAGNGTNDTADDKTATCEVTVTKTVTAPAGNTRIYDGSEQIGVLAGEGYTLSGETAKEAGSYQATAKLDDYYVWADGTTDDKTIDWKIDKASIEVPEGKNLTYNGEEQTGVPEGEGYTLSGETSAKDEGSYQATAKLDGNHVWADGTEETKTINWTISHEHKWDAPTYEWAADNSAVTAARVCVWNADHTETETVKASAEVTEEPTCTAKGKTTYTSAEFNNKAFVAQKKTLEDVEALGHDWKAATCTEPKTCERCKLTEGEALGHKWDDGKVTKEATAEAEGEKTYTCTVAGCGETKTEAIPKLTPAPGPDNGGEEEVKPEPAPVPDNGGEEAKPEPAPEPGSDPDQKGMDGTAVGEGASAASAEIAITSMNSDTDPKGALFSVLRLKSTKQTSNSITLTWAGNSKVAEYVIYGSKSGRNNNPKELARVKGRNTETIREVAGNKLKKGTYYKFIIVGLDGNKNVVSTSKLIHAATKGGKAGNYKSVTVKKSVLKKAKKLKKGKTLKLNARTVAQSKKLKVRKYAAIKYESTNSNVATVSGKGVVKGKSKGTCYVYAYAQNGVFAKIKVTVKK